MATTLTLKRTDVHLYKPERCQHCGGSVVVEWADYGWQEHKCLNCGRRTDADVMAEARWRNHRWGKHNRR